MVGFTAMNIMAHMACTTAEDIITHMATVVGHTILPAATRLAVIATDKVVATPAYMVVINRCLSMRAYHLKL